MIVYFYSAQRSTISFIWETKFKSSLFSSQKVTLYFLGQESDSVDKVFSSMGTCILSSSSQVIADMASHICDLYLEETEVGSLGASLTGSVVNPWPPGSMKVKKR